MKGFNYIQGKLDQSKIHHKNDHFNISRTYSPSIWCFSELACGVSGAFKVTGQGKTVLFSDEHSTDQVRMRDTPIKHMEFIFVRSVATEFYHRAGLKLSKWPKGSQGSAPPGTRWDPSRRQSVHYLNDNELALTRKWNLTIILVIELYLWPLNLMGQWGFWVGKVDASIGVALKQYYYSSC